MQPRMLQLAAECLQLGGFLSVCFWACGACENAYPLVRIAPPVDDRFTSQGICRDCFRPNAPTWIRNECLGFRLPDAIYEE